MEYTLEPDIQRPLKNPLASEQIIRTMPVKSIIPLPIVGGQEEQKDKK